MTDQINQDVPPVTEAEPTTAGAVQPEEGAGSDIAADIPAQAEGQPSSDENAAQAENAGTAEPGTEENGASEKSAGPAEALSDADKIAALFTREDGFLFAKWTRPMVLRVLGTDATGEKQIRSAFASTASAADLGIADEDPELGANMLVAFCDDWRELVGLHGLDALLPEGDRLIARLIAADVNEYTLFNFDADGGIRCAVILLRYQSEWRRMAPETLALTLAARALLLWSEEAFAQSSPVIRRRNGPKIENWFANLLSAAYDASVPTRSTDPALAQVLADLTVKARETALAEKAARAAEREEARKAKAAQKEQDAAELQAQEETATADTAAAAGAQDKREPVAAASDEPVAQIASQTETEAQEAPAPDAPASQDPQDTRSE
ncbi:MAG: hypothetical protein MRY63_12175 [Neomegalonema sp.]|nr:hypothetical protein [Neomegalonema sp.]